MFVDVDQGSQIIHGSNIFNKEEVDLVYRTIQILLLLQQLLLSPEISFLNIIEMILV
jgi:hypothetical protein